MFTKEGTAIKKQGQMQVINIREEEKKDFPIKMEENGLALTVFTSQFSILWSSAGVTRSISHVLPSV